MKYIRTKDGIYEQMFPDCETQRISFDHKTIEPAYYTINHDWVAKKDVINQADNLDELCDDFVLVAPYRFKRPKTAGELDKDFEEMRYFYTDKDDTIYGSIWVGATLKAVAKWNREQEEWDLL